MRSRYHPIEDGLWDDEKFDSLGDLPEAGFVERALFVYLCANPRQRPSGIYRATDAQLSAGCRLPEDEVRTYLASLAMRGLIVRDGSWMYLPGYLRRQAHNPRVLGAVDSQIKSCTSALILASFAAHYPLLHRMLPDCWQTVSQRSTDCQETVERLCSQLGVSDAVPDAVPEQRRPSVGSHEPAVGAKGDFDRIERDTGVGKDTEDERKAENNHRGPLSQVASQAQTMRLKLLDEQLSAMPQRDRFGVWPAAKRLYSAGLPLDTATSILHAILRRWDSILHPWAYLQAVLDKEYREYKIRLQEAEHEATKKLPANVSLIGEVMRRAAEGGTTDAGEKPDAEPWT